MSVLVIPDPGPVLTQAEFNSSFALVSAIINGGLQNDNIAADAAISQEKLGATRTSASIFNGGITIANAGSTGLTVSDGITVTTGGVTVTAGGATITTGGVTVTAGALAVQNGAVNISGVNGIDCNFGGIDADVDLITVGVTGAPAFSWDESADRFSYNKGLVIPFGDVIAGTGLTATTGGLTVNAGTVAIQNGAVNISGVNGIDCNFGGIDADVDLITVGVTGAPAFSWDESADRFSYNKGLVIPSGDVIAGTGLTVTAGGATITAGGLTVTAGGLTVTAGGIAVTTDGITVTAGGLTVTAGGAAITAGGLTVTAGNFAVQSGAVNISGIAGIDFLPGSDLSVDLLTVNVTGTPTLFWDESSNLFSINQGLRLTAGDFGISNGDIALTSGNLSVLSGNLTVTGDTNFNTGSVRVNTANGIDYNQNGGDVDVDLITVVVSGTPRQYWDESDNQFSMTAGLSIDAGDLDVLVGDVVLLAGSITLSQAGATVDGVDLTAHVANVDAHHTQSHTVISHDTSATGLELDTLTSAGSADALHTHPVNALDTDLTTHAALITGVHGTPTAFSAHKGGVDQTGIGGNATVTFTTEDYDVGIGDNFVSSIHTPKVAGKYTYHTNLQVREVNGFNITVTVEFIKNGVTVVASSPSTTIPANGSVQISLTRSVSMDGSADSMLVKILEGGGSGDINIEGTSSRTYFQGHRVALS